MKKHLKIHISSLTVAAVAVVGLAVPIAYAQTTANSEVTQVINEGILSTSIRDSSGNVVSSPTFAMESVSASTSMQTSTGVFGSESQRITVDNPTGNGAWTLALNATTPGTGAWADGANTYAYNGNSAEDGQLTVDPSVGTLFAPTGGSTGVSLGAPATFSGVEPVSLMIASTSAAPIWNGYVTGVSLSQTIPPAQPIGSYTIDMTQTVVAN